MDLKTKVFNTIATGDLNLLKNLLEPLSKAELSAVVSSKNRCGGTTPLLFAIRISSCEIAEYLVTKCKVDIEMVGRVEFDGEKIENAPPIWCAAAVGCMKCVQLLVNNNACVNSTTSTNSTSLRAACFDGHLEIVKYLIENKADFELGNSHGHTCLMIACYKKHFAIASYLIECGAQVNRQSIKLNSALHDATESNDMEIVKLLVRNGATFLRDSFGLTPLMTAALSGNKEIVEYLKLVYKCSIEEEVDGYKLLGATYVDKFYDLSSAFDYWRLALSKSSQCSRVYHESLNNTNDYYKEAYANAREYQNEADLNELHCDPDKMKMQSLIIRERILGIHHPETYYFIRYRGAAYADSGHYSRCLSLWMYNLEQQQGAYKPLSDITQNSFHSIIELFSFMFLKCDSSVRICDIFRVLKLAITELLSSSSISISTGKSGETSAKLYILERKLVVTPKQNKTGFNGDVNGLDRHILIVIQLIGFMCQLRPKMSTNEWRTFKKSVYEFVSFEPRSGSSYALLHVLSILSQNDLIAGLKIPLGDIFSLVVDVSRNLDIRDLCGNTALHLIFKQTPLRLSMVTYLLNRGAHLDLANEDGLTPLDYSNSPNKFKAKYLSLQCLCAQAIAKKSICVDTLSPYLQDFVLQHRSKGFSANVYQS